jgi:hypothetical protein
LPYPGPENKAGNDWPSKGSKAGMQISLPYEGPENKAGTPIERSPYPDSLPVSDEYWNRLSVERKMALLLPYEFTIWGNLVAEFPSDWEKRAGEAVRRTLEETKKVWDDYQTSKKTTDSEEIYEEYDDGYAPEPPPNMSATTYTYTELPQLYVRFIEKLPQCTAMHFGFHVSVPNEKKCYCPCSKKMETWRRQFGLESIPLCNTKSLFMDQSDLFNHLRNSLLDEYGILDFHEIIYYFLQIAYPK